jgi:hypothetical protein
MPRSRTLLLLAVIAALALTSAAPPQHLAPCLHGRIKDITQTLPDGTIVGEPDPHDWGCIEGGSTSGTSASDAIRVGSAGRGLPTTMDVPVGPPPPPTAVCVLPAAPNPAEAGTRFQFTLPAAAHVTLSIVRHARRLGFEPGHTLVRTILDAQLAAGTFSVIWDLTDADGERLDPGIYRAVLVVGDQALCGDIEVR